MIINKIDVAPVFDFAKVKERAKALRLDMQCFRRFSLKGEGFEAWIEWLERE